MQLGLNWGEVATIGLKEKVIELFEEATLVHSHLNRTWEDTHTYNHFIIDTYTHHITIRTRLPALDVHFSLFDYNTIQCSMYRYCIHSIHTHTPHTNTVYTLRISNTHIHRDAHF